MASLLISDATVLTVDSSDTVFAGGWVAFADGRISGAGPRETMPDPAGFDEALALPGHLVMPGLVNAHTHSAMILFRGRSEGQSLLTMEGWYNSIREPELSLAASDIGPAVALSCAEMLLSGTTTFCDQYFFAEEIADAPRPKAASAPSSPTASSARRRRARRPRNWPGPRPSSSGSARRDGRIVPWFGPHAPYVDNSEALLRAEAAMAVKYGCGMHLHMAAGPEDNEETLARYGLTATQALARDGFFAGPRACRPLPRSFRRRHRHLRRGARSVGRLLRDAPGCARAARASARW